MDSSFRTLGLQKGKATKEDVIKAFRKLAPINHPNKAGPAGTAKMQELVAARDDILKNYKFIDPTQRLRPEAPSFYPSSSSPSPDEDWLDEPRYSQSEMFERIRIHLNRQVGRPDDFVPHPGYPIHSPPGFAPFAGVPPSMAQGEGRPCLPQGWPQFKPPQMLFDPALG